ncbi:hypothetical protein A0J48_026400 [Sphaerospermopsis aphanizomenoides BCCUSP55]|uniref:hypothetical protein n=1 Tax=Sphaerospermopsis aphanizomenoides TaxID=459663 RepID=UPI0019075786|nr:hypothetical protein [Sphaerospermopsis aphanizomenoides]MBK1990994.1 hypothetical protein [Sphaerospermopsis aphanizomenoides BCCUSP55]
MTNTIPQPIKTRLAELAVFPEKYSLADLAAELRLLAAEVSRAAAGAEKLPWLS